MLPSPRSYLPPKKARAAKGRWQKVRMPALGYLPLKTKKRCGEFFRCVLVREPQGWLPRSATTPGSVTFQTRISDLPYLPTSSTGMPR